MVLRLRKINYKIGVNRVHLFRHLRAMRTSQSLFGMKIKFVQYSL